MPRIDEHSNTLASARDHCINFLALGVSSTSLDIIFEQVLVDCIENDLRRLGSGCVVEEYEILTPIQRGKRAPSGLDRELPSAIASFRQENRLVHSSSTARSRQAFMSG
jgi:hypothetical protein